MRGRKPKPLRQQIAEGDPRKKGKRKLEEQLKAEPKAARGLPSCPRHLAGRARSAWRFWRTELVEMKLDCRPDAVMLEGACVNYARAVQADQVVAREGITVEDARIDEESGEKIILKIRTHPAVSVSNQAWRQVRSFCSEFGLSPVSRTRLPVEKQNDTVEVDLMKLLSQPREAKAKPSVH